MTVSLADVLAGRAELVVLAEVTYYDPGSDSEQVRYYSTHGLITLATDSVAPGRYYPARLQWPRLTWSRWSGTSIGSSSPDEVTLELSAQETEDDITADGLVVDGRPITLRLGARGMDLADWLPWYLTGKTLYRAGSGERLVIRASSPDVIFDQPVSRSRYLGLGGCLSFDGSTYAEIAHHSSLLASSALCVEALVELGATGSVQVVASKGTAAPTGDGEAALFVGTDDKPRAWIWSDSGVLTVAIGPAALSGGTLYRLTARWSGAALELYVDGALVATQPFAGPLRRGTEPVTIGDDGTGTRRLTGKVDDVRWWVDSAVPTPDEIAEWARQELPEEEHRSPAAYLRCNEPAGSAIAYDDSGHGRDATLYPGAGSLEDMWSTLYEGQPDQRDKAKPLAIGELPRVSGVQISDLIHQLHEGAVRGIGPVDEGALYLAQRMTRTGSDIAIDPASGISAAVPEDTVRTAGSVDFGGLIPGQYVRITTPSQTATVRVLALATPTEIRVRSGSLSAEAAGGSVTVETTGWIDTATDVAFTASTITSASGSFPALPAGTEITVSGAGSNNGTYPLASDSAAGVLTFAPSTFSAAPAGPSITLEAEELWDYETDLSRGLAILRRVPTLPLGFAVRGPSAAGSDRSGILQWIAARAGVVSVDAKSFGDLEVIDAHAGGRWLSSSDEVTYRELIDHFAVGDSVGFGPATGKLEVAVRAEPTSPEIDLDYGTQLFGLQAREAASPIAGQACPWGVHDVVLSEDQVAGLARILYPTQVDFAREASRIERADEDPVVRLRHPQAEDGTELDSPYTTPAGAKAAAQRAYDLESVIRQVWVAEGPLLPLLVDLRQDSIRLLSTDHAGLDTGLLCKVLRIEIDTARLRATVYLWG